MNGFTQRLTFRLLHKTGAGQMQGIEKNNKIKRFSEMLILRALPQTGTDWRDHRTKANAPQLISRIGMDMRSLRFSTIVDGNAT